MTKKITSPTLFDDCKTISISFLKKHGYFKANQCKIGTINWSVNGNKTGSISILLYAQPESPYLEFDYNYNGIPINYRVQLVSVPSNLGKGFIWFFVCPKTNMRCRKLYLVTSYFYHRLAVKGCMYETQTFSRSCRSLKKTLDGYFKSNELLQQLNSKNFKKEYLGKQTKKYLKLINSIEKLNLKY